MNRTSYDKQEARLRLVLRHRRQELGMKQEELASKMGKARNFVSKYEQGERGLSFTETLELCHWLGIRERDLIDAVYGDDMKRRSSSEDLRAHAEMLAAAEQGESAGDGTSGTPLGD